MKYLGWYFSLQEPGMGLFGCGMRFRRIGRSLGLAGLF